MDKLRLQFDRSNIGEIESIVGHIESSCKIKNHERITDGDIDSITLELEEDVDRMKAKTILYEIGNYCAKYDDSTNLLYAVIAKEGIDYYGGYATIVEYDDHGYVKGTNMKLALCNSGWTIKQSYSKYIRGSNLFVTQPCEKPTPSGVG